MRFRCPVCHQEMKLHLNSKGGYLFCVNVKCCHILQVMYHTEVPENIRGIIMIPYGPTGIVEIIKGDLPRTPTHPHSGVSSHFIDGGKGLRPLKNESSVRQMPKDNPMGVPA